NQRILRARDQYNASKTIYLYLEAGKTPFELTYFQNTPWWLTRLGIFNVSSFPEALHSLVSYPLRSNEASPIYVDVGAKPELLRAFLDFEGDRSQRLTHTIAVGGPQGVHFVYDLKTATPVCAWRGEFLDATPMWDNRGDGSFRPRGAAQFLFHGQSILPTAALEQNFFDQTLQEVNGFRNLGYSIDQRSQYPVFRYELDSLSIHDQLLPDTDQRGLERKLSFQGLQRPEKGAISLKLGEGKQIQKLPDGTYVIDQAYYLQPLQDMNLQIIKRGGMMQLVAP
ncbi:MAG: hypothetical protein AAFQ87_28375, partial [Bacteroidota bacterium]